MRKTVPINDLKERANHFLKHSVDSNKEGRLAVAMFFSGILMSCNRYNGYNFLDARMMKDSNCGTTVGIKDGETVQERFEDTDHTRRYYY